MRKTLVRACAECNGLASDLPHMDYLERHLALKMLLIQRYHHLMLSAENRSEDLGIDTDASYLNAVIKNHAVLRQQLFSAIGFGIHDISQIESAFLKRKNAEGKTLESLLLAYLTAAPVEPEPDTHQIAPFAAETTANKRCSWPAEEFRLFLQVENRALPKSEWIYSQTDYDYWLLTHPSRTAALEVPGSPEFLKDFCWPTK